MTNLPENIVTHQSSWLNALERLIELEVDEDQKLYWQHERNAMLDMYSDLKSVGDSSAPDLDAMVEASVNYLEDVAKGKARIEWSGPY